MRGAWIFGWLAVVGCGSPDTGGEGDLCGPGFPACKAQFVCVELSTGEHRCLSAGGGSVDARISVDAQPRCTVQLMVTPTNPVAGPTPLVATAVRTGDTGLVVMTWRVTGPPGDVATTALDPDALRVSFLAPLAGPYVVGGSATSGGQTCEVVQAIINVAADDQATAEIRLSYIPTPLDETPRQVDRQVVVVRGGADFALPAPRVLEGGATVDGTVTGPAGGFAAYLRLEGEETTTELFADPLGHYRGLVPAGPHDVLVVPYAGDLPPQRFLGVSASQLGAFTLDAGDEIGGRVLASGTPVSGARVTVAAAGLPPLLVTTGGDGRFVTHVRAAAGPLSVSVLPPSPALRFEGGSGTIAAGAQVTVTLAEPAPAPVALAARGSDGQALAGATVVFATAPSEGGSLTIDGGAVQPGRSHLRQVAISGVDGALPPLRVPDGTVMAVVVPPANGDVIGVATLTAPFPGSVAAAAPLALDVAVVDRGGAVVAGARVIAVARGVSGVGMGLASSGTTGPLGSARLSRLVPGMIYDVTVDPPPGRRLARSRATFTGGGEALQVTLGPAIELTGRVLLPSGVGQAGIRVEARHEGDPTLLAETITAAGGTFSLWIPDPGPKLLRRSRR